jgi:hypothetical protein
MSFIIFFSFLYFKLVISSSTLNVFLHNRKKKKKYQQNKQVVSYAFNLGKKLCELNIIFQEI